MTDHITPWTSSYSTTQLVKGDTRFVLSSSGHIAGIVNPPSPKARHWTNDENPSTPRSGWPGRPSTGSWWEDWVGWAKAHGGQRRKPRPWAATCPPSPPPRAAHPRGGPARPDQAGMDGAAAEAAQAVGGPQPDPPTPGAPGGGYPDQGAGCAGLSLSPRRRLLTPQAARSKMAAMPWPPPMHMVTRARRPPVRLSS